MELSIIIPHIEALIFASEKPLVIDDIVELLNNALGFIDDRATPEQVEAAIQAISEKYNSEFYAFEMVESGGGWQFLTKKEYHKTIAQLNGDKFLKKLSVASIETLSIIAYKQPVTKSEIELIRGVNCDYAVQKLLEKDLIIISGRKEDAVGKPLIYATSKSFMDYFGINSPEDLPKINEILKQEIIEATKIEKQESADASEKESLKEKIIVEEIEEVIASEESDFEETVNNSNEENNSEENNTA
jgi:segregation and condensation protein B